VLSSGARKIGEMPVGGDGAAQCLCLLNPRNKLRKMLDQKLQSTRLSYVCPMEGFRDYLAGPLLAFPTVLQLTIASPNKPLHRAAALAGVAHLLVVALVWTCIATVVVAQPRLFGSLDDPAELPHRGWWLADQHLEVLGGFSLIGAQWRTATRIRAHFESEEAALEIDGSLRAGIYGRYGIDSDEPYDLLRVLNYARITKTNGYARVGTATRLRLGLGHLLDFYNGGADWDERRIGLEASLAGSRLRVFGMASDLGLGRLVAGRVELRPLPMRGRAGSFWIGFAAITDRRFSGEAGPSEPPGPTAFEVDVRFTAAESGAFLFKPFASLASLHNYGRGLMMGADLEADNFIDLARVHARLAVQYSEAGFRPGYFGAFYEVQNPVSAIASSSVDDAVASIPLRATSKGTYVLSELRLHFFDRLEFYYAFRRHFGAQPLSSYHLRLFIAADRFRFYFSEDRGGLRGFLSLLNSIGDQSLMSFRTDYRVAGPLWLRIDARYGYVRLSENQGRNLYSVQRRFEPYLGLRVSL